jgi:eukaryotic-like serine/threonine-protein kinase
MKSAVPDPFAKGQRIDRYEIGELIGQGGMGAVYRAFDTKLGRTVALKTVVADRRGERLTEEVRQRFVREALAISKVEHRNVVQVLDFGFADNGTPFLVMELLRGRDLGGILNEDDEPLQVAYVADVLLGVCAALRACHHLGIVHRDLKPGNIFVIDTETGFETKVLDFGISKAPRTADLTVDGQILGTPHYLSPEQVTGTAGPESDQYALGVVLYVCLTKRLPYQQLRDFALLRAITLGQFDPPSVHRSDLPAEVDDIVRRAMRVDPKDRFQSVHELGQALWKLASARGKEQWKGLFLHTPPPLRPANQSTHGIAMIEAMAARPAGEASPLVPVLGSVALRTTTPGAEAALATGDSGDGQRLLSTKLSPPSEAVVDGRRPPRGKAKRRSRGWVLAVGGVVALAAGGVGLWARARAPGRVATVGAGSAAPASAPVEGGPRPATATAPPPSVVESTRTGAADGTKAEGRPAVRGTQRRTLRSRAERAVAAPPTIQSTPPAVDPSPTGVPVGVAPPSKYPAVGLTPQQKYPAVR